MIQLINPRMTVLEHLCAAAEQGLRFDEDAVVVAVQHLLATNVALFDCLRSLGLRPDNTYVIGKGYSTSTCVVDALRTRGINVFPNSQQARIGCFAQSFEDEVSNAVAAVERHAGERTISRLIILDDGGRLLARYSGHKPNQMPIVGVEQTTSGIRRMSGKLGFPIVDVAQSAAKLGYESPLIAEAVINKLGGIVRDFSAETRCGVVGRGSVGKAVVSHLERRGHRVLVAELPQFGQAADLRKTLSFPDILTESEVVLGCTGTNLFDDRCSLPTLRSNLFLASCSSEDIEFYGLIAQHADYGEPRDWPAPNLTLQHRGHQITVLRGGYPVNFDSTVESARSEDIQLTTSLVLAGVMTALSVSKMPSASNVFLKLPPEIQNAILQDWFSTAQAVKRLASEYLVRADLPRLTALSHGESIDLPELKQIASSMTGARHAA